MSTEQIWQTESTSLEDTLALGAQTGCELKGGETIELAGDLGGGKTAFVRGLAQGAGSKDPVTSPSFTISNQYKADNGLVIHHFDFYRLEEPGIMRDEIAEILADKKAVAVIEWAGAVDDVLPDERLTIRFAASGENSRKIAFEYPENLNYLIVNT